MDLEPLTRFSTGVDLFARARDEAEVQALLARTPMRLTGFELYYDRSPEFSALLNCRAAQYVTPMFRKGAELLAFASFSWSPRFIGQAVENVCYVGDMRSTGTRAAARVWRECYPEIIRLAHAQNIKHFLTVVMADNSEALKNLVNSSRDHGFSYDLLRSLTMCNCIARKPWRRNIDSASAAHKIDFTLRRATAADETELIEFLQSENSRKLFGFDFKNYEFNHRKQNWPGFRLENFLVLVNAADEIVGCTLPWSPSPVKRMRLQNVETPMRAFLLLCQATGVRLPNPGQAIETLYLTHLTFSSQLTKAQIAHGLRAFIAETMRTSREMFHMLSWADEWGLADEVNSAFFTQKTEVNLYAVRLSRSARIEPNRIESIGDIKVGFEMALA